MAKTLVENRVCAACGADVRKGALFCYHCGGSVAPEIPAPDNHKNDFDDVQFQEKTGDNRNNKETSRLNLETAERTDKEPVVYEIDKLKSAASMRRKAKVFQRKKIEVVWEEPQNASNGWFIFAAVILTLLAVGILFLAMYLR